MRVPGKKRFGTSGFSLVETMAAMVILVIAALGALGYQYHAAGQSRIANAQIVATRTAQLLLEDWKSTGGSNNYDPSTLELGFSSALQIPESFGMGQGTTTPLHNAVYAITIDNIPMMVMLSWVDVAEDTTAQITLRQLDVTVNFGSVDDEASERQVNNLSTLPPLILTTYVRLDESGG